VSHAAHAPVGLSIVRTPARSYAIFLHEDHVSTLPQTYAAIWNDWVPESGAAIGDGPSLEQHRPTFDTKTGYGGVQLWIPLA
jgi:AraC family transcriptional regulator